MPRTILVADDSTTIRKIVELTFSDTDHHVETAASGAEALERIGHTAPDLILADVVMPGPDGYEICRKVKDSDRPVPVLLLTGTFEPFDAELARDCGADGNLVKPFESRALRDRVERLLETGAAPPRRVEEHPETVAPPGDEPEPAVEANEGLEAAAVSGREAEPAAAPVKPPAAVDADDRPAGADPALVDTVARAVVERLSERVVREIAWEVVPELAAKIIRERIRELEGEESGEE